MTQPPATINYRHEAIARWMIENPHRNLKECARELGYTPTWVYCVTGSDAFKEYYEKLRDAADGMSLISTRAKMQGIAQVALDKLSEAIEDTLTTGEGGRRDREFLLESADTLLHRLGYAPTKAAQSPPQAPPLSIQADRVVINQAVAAMEQKFEPLKELPSE